MNFKNAHLLRWILVETSHPGNVGSAARALKTMGFDDLRLINPKMAGIAQEAEAIALASGASDVLARSQESDSLESVVQGCSLVLGLTSRDREFGPPAPCERRRGVPQLEAVHRPSSIARFAGAEAYRGACGSSHSHKT